jgi:hypothetical protein
MKVGKIYSKISKKFKHSTTNSNHSYEVSPNILNQKFQVEEPGEVWVSDITYIKVNKEWMYLTVILDLFNREVIGWDFSSNLESSSLIKFSDTIKDLILDGDTIDCYFALYYAALINDVTESGSGYKVNEQLNINKNTYFDSSNNRNERAILQVKSVDSNGGITELHLINNGNFTQNFEQA